MTELFCPRCGEKLTVHHLDGWGVVECPRPGCAYLARLCVALYEALTREEATALGDRWH
jgi:hypothetical protein